MDAYLTGADISRLRRSERGAEKLASAGLPAPQLRGMLSHLAAALALHNVYRTSRNRQEILDAKAEVLRRAREARSEYISMRERIESSAPDAKSRRNLLKLIDDAYIGVVRRMRARKDGL